LRAICRDGLTETRRTLGTDVPASVLSRLAAPGAAELAAGYLRPGRWRQHLLELRALRSWGKRLRLIREWFIPPAAYMLTKYGKQGHWRLP
jgi:hypothetical protein